MVTGVLTATCQDGDQPDWPTRAAMVSLLKGLAWGGVGKGVVVFQAAGAAGAKAGWQEGAWCAVEGLREQQMGKGELQRWAAGRALGVHTGGEREPRGREGMKGIPLADVL